MKRHKVQSPKTPVFSGMRFIVPLGTYNIKIASGGKETTPEFIIPTDNAIYIMEMLSLVFAQVNCIHRLCTRRLNLYESILKHGMQYFMVLKCTHCHNLAAEISSYSPYCFLSCGQHQQ